MGFSMISSTDPKRKHNIIFLIDGLGMGGAERMMVPILKHLNKDEFSPRVCVFQEKDGNPIADDLRDIGVPVDFLPIPFLRDITALPRLRKYLRESNADIVHTQLEFADTLGNMAAKLLGLPSVCTIHTLPPQDVSTRSKSHQVVERFSLRWFCDRVIAVSEEARAYYLHLGGVKASQIVTIYNGIDMTIFDSMNIERSSLRRELGIPVDAHLITTVAVLREPKGIQFMLQALPAILSFDPRAYYLIVGDGPHSKALQNEAGKLLQNDRIVFTGMRRDVPRILAASDIFVLPTLTEALPTVLMEAMACRLPVIASAVGGIPEMVINGENGILVFPGDSSQLSDACISLLRDDEVRRSMGVQGRRIVHEKFTIRGQVERMTHLYRELIEIYG